MSPPRSDAFVAALFIVLLAFINGAGGFSVTGLAAVSSAAGHRFGIDLVDLYDRAVGEEDDSEEEVAELARLAGEVAEQEERLEELRRVDQKN